MVILQGDDGNGDDDSIDVNEDLGGDHDGIGDSDT